MVEGTGVLGGMEKAVAAIDLRRCASAESIVCYGMATSIIAKRKSTVKVRLL